MQEERPKFDDEDGDNAQMGSQEVIYDPLLAYVAFGLGNSSAESVKQSAGDFYGTEEAIEARDKLWDAVDASLIPDKKRRQNMQTRKSIRVTVADIVEALQKLDEAKKLPRIAVPFEKIHRLPLAMPAETSPISMCDRIAKLEARMDATEKMVASNACTLRYGKEETDAWPPLPGSSVPRKPPLAFRETLGTGESTVPKTHDQDNAQPWASIAPTGPQAEDSFQPPRRRNRRKRPKPVECTGNTRGALQGAPEPSREVFVYRVVKEASEHDIEEHLKDNGVNYRNVTKRSADAAKFKSFSVEVLKSQFEKVMAPEFWPTGVCVRKFLKKRTINHGDGS